MNYIEFTIIGKHIVCARSGVIADNTDYMMRFVFDADWDGYPDKTVLILDGKARLYEIHLEGGATEVKLPKFIGRKLLAVGVTATNDDEEIASDAVLLRVDPSIRTGASEAIESPESGAKDLLEEYREKYNTLIDELQSAIDSTYLGITGASAGQVPVVKTVDENGVPTEWEATDMPSGGGGTDTSLGLTGATVGQTVKIKAVDETGAPTEWEATDMASGGNASTGNWKLIRKITVPDDPTTDESGVTWIVDDTDAVIGIEFDTDENGNAFNCNELSITGVGTCAAAGRLDYYAGDTLLCSYNGQQVNNLRYSWVWLRRLGAVWQAVGSTAASWRFIHDMQGLSASGFQTGPETPLNSVAELSLRGTQAYNAGYKFEIWGR